MLLSMLYCILGKQIDFKEKSLTKILRWENFTTLRQKVKSYQFSVLFILQRIKKTAIHHPKLCAIETSRAIRGSRRYVSQ